MIGHGNGPQVGNVMLQHEGGKKHFNIESMPMDFCVAETQGSIGYLIEQGFRNVFAKENIDRKVLTLLTQVVVDEKDSAFQNPVKPVGPYLILRKKLMLLLKQVQNMQRILKVINIVRLLLHLSL